MLYRVSPRSPQPGASASGRLSGSFALLLSATIGLGAQAQSCTTTTQSPAGCTIDPRSTRLGELLSTDPTAGRLDPRLDGKPWIAQDWNMAPLAVTPGDGPGDGNVSVRTSTTHWTAHNDWSTARRIDELKAAGNAAAMAYKPGRRDPALDVWSTLDVQGLEDNAVRSRRGGVGADFKLAPRTVLGAAVEMREKAPHGAPAAQDDYTVSTYVATRPVPSVTLDARAQWGESNATLLGYGFSSTQSAVAARVRGNWRFGDIRFAPSVSLAHGAEMSAGGPAGTEPMERSTLAIEPRVSRPIPLGGGETLEPFVTYSRRLEFDARAAGAAGVAASEHKSAGAGLTLAKPDAYSLSVTGAVDGLGEPQTPSLKGQLQLKIPLR